MTFCRKAAKCTFRKYLLVLWYNHEDILRAKSAAKIFGELSIFSELLRTNVLRSRLAGWSLTSLFSTKRLYQRRKVSGGE